MVILPAGSKARQSPFVKDSIVLCLLAKAFELFPNSNNNLEKSPEQDSQVSPGQPPPLRQAQNLRAETCPGYTEWMFESWASREAEALG